MSLRIVIVGAGQVGYNLSKSLAKEDYAITVVDIDEKKCLKVKNAIDAKVVLGNGASQRILQQIDMTNIDYFLALTSLDEINLIASKTAKTLGAKKVIARLRSTEFSHKDAVLSPKHFEIDHVSYPEKAAQKEIEKLIRRASAVEVITFNNDQITLLGIKLETSSPLVGRSVRNVKLANPFINHQTAVIYREDSSFVPHSNTIYNKDDVVYFVSRTDDVDPIQQLAGKPAFNVENIMIVGAGKIGENQRGEIVIPSLQVLGVPLPEVSDVYSTDTLLELGIQSSSVNLGIRSAVFNLKKHIAALDNHVVGRIGQRWAVSMLPLLAILLGSILAIRNITMMPLEVYARVFIPAVIALLLVFSGGQMIRDANVGTGFFTMWIGNVFLLLLIVWNWLKLRST